MKKVTSNKATYSWWKRKQGRSKKSLCIAEIERMRKLYDMCSKETPKKKYEKGEQNA